MFELPSLPQEMGEIVVQGLRLGRLLYRRLLNLTTIIAFLGLIPTVAQVWGRHNEVLAKSEELTATEVRIRKELANGLTLNEALAKYGHV